MTKEMVVRLIGAAKKASENAYCPYSGRAVGCALLCADEKNDNYITSGCNIEIGDFESTINAVDGAVGRAIADGYSSFKAICLFSAEAMPYLTGSMRQVLAEFSRDLSLKIIVSTNKSYDIIDLANLFPLAPKFDIEN